MDQRSPDLLKPTLLAGLIFGAAGGAPFLQVINCACCALVIACGFLASYLYSNECRRVGAEFRAGMGAIVGLVAGCFYALVQTLVGTLVSLTIGDVIVARMVDWVRGFPNLPPETLETLDQFVEQAGTFSIAQLILGFIFWVFVAAIFSTLGGLIGGAAFRVNRPAPEPPLAPPPPPPPAAPPPYLGGGPDSTSPPPANPGL